jgi:hypothetical protein
VAAARLGAHREQAALAAGISRSTLQAWLAKGEADRAPDRFRDFARALREAEVEAELEALRAIESAAAEGDWRAMTCGLSGAGRSAGAAVPPTSCPVRAASRSTSAERAVGTSAG